ncbi:BlaI/MecI/CopY family transcriptional regulator [Streptomyces sp. SP17BM10]|uniref:BlaI/MecI/CopY family transcriptional regulator n=1 Tax=Streptomyces sp. SP17BM10 TaxID=3002530 RepID=UPI002E760413|nr:BlaI/MecI/CopY family transcriptional regulator [Streptomyces sp. SP17BM10]MEE1786396.1 BlaI/MecI/CopY family transcriptional regulator [Streptomyces sp. SP17BM10]
MRGFGDLEAEIMDRLWSWGRPATVREVVDDLRQKRPVAYTTVTTVADILHTKGWLRRDKVGRAWVYEPTCTREAYTARLMHQALETTADRTGALLHFVDAMSGDEAGALLAALEQVKARDDER